MDVTMASPSVSAAAAPAASGPAAGPRFSGVRALGGTNKDGSFYQAACDARHNGAQVAIKYLPRSRLGATHQQVLREVLTHHQLSLSNYPHIVQFREVFVTPRYLGVVMEHVEGQDLQSYLMKEGGSLSVDVARFLFQQLVLAVDFMHKRGKVHRDLRLTNVLVVDSGVMPLIKLRNFALSKDSTGDNPPRGQVGVALFTAPEVVLNVGGHPYNGELVDAWSCGVILYMMLYGHHPFLTHADMALGEAEQMVRLIENEVKGHLHFPAGAEPSVCDLLRRVLVPAPKQRYNLGAIMGHAWFQKKLPPGALELNSQYLQATTYQDVRQTTSTIKQLVQAAAAGQDATPASAPSSGPTPVPTPTQSTPAPTPRFTLQASEYAASAPDAAAAAAAAAAAVLVDLSRPPPGPVVWPGMVGGQAMGHLLVPPGSLQHTPTVQLALEQAAMRMFALSADQLARLPSIQPR